MSDVFISFSPLEANQCLRAAEILSDLDVKVGWEEPSSARGANAEIAAAKTAAKVILVLWSPSAAVAPHVVEDAKIGLADVGGQPKRYVGVQAVAMSGTKLPYPFSGMKPLNWVEGLNPDLQHELDVPGFLRILKAIGERLGRPGLAALGEARTAAKRANYAKLFEWVRNHPEDPSHGRAQRDCLDAFQRLERDSERLTATVSELTHQISDGQHQIAVLQPLLASRVAEVAEISAKHEAAQVQISAQQKQISTQSAELKTLDANLTETRNELEDIQAQLDEVEQDKAALDQHSLDLAQQLKTALQHLEQKAAEVVTTSEDLSSAKQALLARDEQIKTLEAAGTAAHAKIDTFMSDNQRLSGLVKSLQGEIESLGGQTMSRDLRLKDMERVRIDAVQRLKTEEEIGKTLSRQLSETQQKLKSWANVPWRRIAVGGLVAGSLVTYGGGWLGSRNVVPSAPTAAQVRMPQTLPQTSVPAAPISATGANTPATIPALPPPDATPPDIVDDPPPPIAVDPDAPLPNSAGVVTGADGLMVPAVPPQDLNEPPRPPETPKPTGPKLLLKPSPLAVAPTPTPTP